MYIHILNIFCFASLLYFVDTPLQKYQMAWFRIGVNRNYLYICFPSVKYLKYLKFEKSQYHYLLYFHLCSIKILPSDRKLNRNVLIVPPTSDLYCKTDRRKNRIFPPCWFPLDLGEQFVLFVQTLRDFAFDRLRWMSDWISCFRRGRVSRERSSQVVETLEKAGNEESRNRGKKDGAEKLARYREG